MSELRICGYRRAQGQVHYDGETPVPQDNFKDNKCSYCGGLDPEVLLEQVRLGKAEVIPTDKTYKIYVNLIQEDGSKQNHKCYFYDFTKAQMLEFVRLYNLNVTDKENISTMKIGAPGHFYVLPFFFKSEFSRRN